MPVHGVPLVFSTFSDQKHFSAVLAIVCIVMPEVCADGGMHVSEGGLADTVVYRISQNVVEQHSLPKVTVDLFAVGVVLEQGSGSAVFAVEVAGVGQFYPFDTLSRVCADYGCVRVSGHDGISGKNVIGVDYRQCNAVLESCVVLFASAYDFILPGM